MFNSEFYSGLDALLEPGDPPSIFDADTEVDLDQVVTLVTPMNVDDLIKEMAFERLLDLIGYTT